MHYFIPGHTRSQIDKIYHNQSIILSRDKINSFRKLVPVVLIVIAVHLFTENRSRNNLKIWCYTPLCPFPQQRHHRRTKRHAHAYVDQPPTWSSENLRVKKELVSKQLVSQTIRQYFTKYHSLSVTYLNQTRIQQHSCTNSIHHSANSTSCGTMGVIRASDAKTSCNANRRGEGVDDGSKNRDIEEPGCSGKGEQR